MSKIRRSISIDKELMNWINQQIAQRRFKDVSHAFEFAVYHLRQEEEKTETKTKTKATP
jgi:Arc/MetJ-type ribon-helix-helix transcriptional regulator